jgi:hypothetical protein
MLRPGLQQQTVTINLRKAGEKSLLKLNSASDHLFER